MNRLYYLLFVAVSLLCIVGCNNNRTEIKNQVLKAVGLSVPVPEEYSIYKNGKLVSNPINFNEPIIVAFSNYSACPSCDIMKIEDWFTLVTEIEDMDCQVVYIVNNTIDRNIKAQVINDRSNISIMLIEDKLFNDFANKITPINTFLMDKNKKIVLVGNPVYNAELWNLYKKAILQLR